MCTKRRDMSPPAGPLVFTAGVSASVTAPVTLKDVVVAALEEPQAGTDAAGPGDSSPALHALPLFVPVDRDGGGVLMLCECGGLHQCSGRTEQIWRDPAPPDLESMHPRPGSMRCWLRVCANRNPNTNIYSDTKNSSEALQQLGPAGIGRW